MDVIIPIEPVVPGEYTSDGIRRASELLGWYRSAGATIAQQRQLWRDLQGPETTVYLFHVAGCPKRFAASVVKCGCNMGQL